MQSPFLPSQQNLLSQFLLTTKYFDYNEAVVIRRDESGEIISGSRVAKVQSTMDDKAAYSSYATMIRPEESILIYNDHRNNLAYTGSGKVAPMVKGKKMVVVAARVNVQGEIQRVKLFTWGEADTKPRPSFGVQLNANEILLFGQQELKKQRFIRVRF